MGSSVLLDRKRPQTQLALSLACKSVLARVTHYCIVFANDCTSCKSHSLKGSWFIIHTSVVQLTSSQACRTTVLHVAISTATCKYLALSPVCCCMQPLGWTESCGKFASRVDPVPTPCYAVSTFSSTSEMQLLLPYLRCLSHLF